MNLKLMKLYNALIHSPARTAPRERERENVKTENCEKIGRGLVVQVGPSEGGEGGPVCGNHE